MQKLLLFSGWGVRPTVFQPLQAALAEHGFDTTLAPIFDIHNKTLRRHYQQQACEAAIVGGWSLGGQLAACMVDDLCRLGQGARRLITLASNPCFTAQHDWPHAMDQVVFRSFTDAFMTQPHITLRRFAALMCRGDAHVKSTTTIMHQHLDQPSAVLDCGLRMLEQWDGRALLRRLQVPQYHILAQCDALVPATAHMELAQLNPAMDVCCVDGAAHALIYTHAEVLAALFADWINGGNNKRI